MAGRLAGKVALITGAGSGIGRATALLFAGEGASVAVVDIADDNARETVSLIEQSGGRGLFVHADVAVAAEAEHMIEATVRRFGRLDILHNNAFWTVFHRTVETSEYEWDRTLAVCLKAPFLAAKYAIPHMLRNGGGVIINTSSVSGIRGQSAHAAYETAKGGLLALTRSLAADCAPKIRVNAILPGGRHNAGPSAPGSCKDPGKHQKDTAEAARPTGRDRSRRPLLGRRRVLVLYWHQPGC